MPPRIRTIKPDLWRNTQVQSCSRDARLAFIGLISHADDEGRLHDDPGILRSSIFPGDADLSLRRFVRLLDELEQSIDAHGIPLIRRYSVGRLGYIEIPKWGQHQRINRPTPSAIPSYSTSLNGHGTFSEEDLPIGLLSQ